MTTSSFRLCSSSLVPILRSTTFLCSFFNICLLKYSLFFYFAHLEKEKIMYPFSFDFHTLACFPQCVLSSCAQPQHISVSSESTRIVHIIGRTEHCCVVSEKLWLRAFPVMDSVVTAEGRFDEIDIFAVAISEVSRKSEWLIIARVKGEICQGREFFRR